MELVALRPAVVKSPPAYRLLPDTASARRTVLGPGSLRPEPRADQLLPFHLAMLVAAIPPAPVHLGIVCAALPAYGPANPPDLQVTPPHRPPKLITLGDAHPRTQRRPTAPVPFGDVIGRAATRIREGAPRVHVAARHRQRI